MGGQNSLIQCALLEYELECSARRASHEIDVSN